MSVMPALGNVSAPNEKVAALIAAHFDLIRDTAKTGCYDWYLAALLSPSAVRGEALAIAAFAADVLRIPNAITEPMMGAIRLQWWRDAIEDKAPPTGNPLADIVREMCAHQPRLRGFLTTVIDSQEFELQPAPLQDDAELAIHHNNLWGALFSTFSERLTRDTHQPLSSDTCFKAASAYGVACLALEYAYTQAAAPPHTLPTSRRRRNGTTSPDPVPGAEVFHVNHTGEGQQEPAQPAQSQKAQLQSLVQLAEEALQAVRNASQDRKHPALRPLALVPLYLKCAQKHRTPSNLSKSWAMWCNRF